MLRSFTNRVLGGVCGGLGAALRLPAWAVRGAFALLTVISLGVFVVPYVMLWWIVPQESYVERRRRGVPTLIVLLLLVLTAGAWLGRAALRTETGVDLLWPGLLVALAVVFFLRQLGGR